MRLWIDTNILLDVLQNRGTHIRSSSVIWKLCETEQAKGFVSVLAFANIVYIMRKEMSPKKIKEILRTLSLIFEFVDFTASDLSRASELNWNGLFTPSELIARI